MGIDLSANSKLACVGGGMRERASGGAAIFHRGRSRRGIRERRSREGNPRLPHLEWFLLAAHF